MKNNPELNILNMSLSGSFTSNTGEIAFIETSPNDYKLVYGITCSEEGGGGRQLRENSLSFMFTTLIRLKVPYNVWGFFRNNTLIYQRGFL